MNTDLLFYNSEKNELNLFDAFSGNVNKIIPLKDKTDIQIAKNLFHYIIWIHGKRILNFYDINLNEIVHKCSLPEAVRSLEFLCDAQILICGGISGRLYIWEMNEGNLIRTFQSLHTSIELIRIFCDNTFLFVGGKNGIIKIYCICDIFSVVKKESLNEIRIFVGHTDVVTSIISFPFKSFHSSFSYISSSLDGSIKFWSLHASNSKISIIFPSPITQIQIHKFGHELYACSGHSKIYIVDIIKIFGSLKSPNETFYIESKHTENNCNYFDVLVGHSGLISDCFFDPESNRLISCASDGIRIWDLKNKLALMHLNFIGNGFNKIFSLKQFEMNKMLPLLRFSALKTTPLSSDELNSLPSIKLIQKKKRILETEVYQVCNELKNESDSLLGRNRYNLFEELYSMRESGLDATKVLKVLNAQEAKNRKLCHIIDLIASDTNRKANSWNSDSNVFSTLLHSNSNNSESCSKPKANLLDANYRVKFENSSQF